jgi:hypothetical protein
MRAGRSATGAGDRAVRQSEPRNVGRHAELCRHLVARRRDLREHARRRRSGRSRARDPAVEHATAWASPPGALVSAMWPALAGAAPYVPPVAAIGIAPPSLASVPDPGWSVRPVPYTGGAVVPSDVLMPPEQRGTSCQAGLSPLVMAGLGRKVLTVVTPAVWRVAGASWSTWMSPSAVGDQAITSSSTFPMARRSAAAS